MYERKFLGVWLMYLRKSRQDNPTETIAEVLAKHELQLQEHATRELGGRIAEENIYREVISGESIDEREEIKKILTRIEDPAVVGVLVIEPQRLSRGDLLDCGRLINAFRFTHTQICTPVMTYDLENKMDRKFFQDELLRGRDYLEYTKEILARGRIAAVKRGCFIGAIPPFGYDKIKDGKNHTLAPNGDADTVRAIFDWYAKEGLSPAAIAERLNNMDISTSRGGKWRRETIRDVLSNIHYRGKVAYNQTKSTPVLENSQIVVKRLKQSEDNMLIVEGKHPAIINTETWDATQSRLSNNQQLGQSGPSKNPLKGLLRCGCCGYSVFIHSYENIEARFMCRTNPPCFKPIKQSMLIAALLNTLEFSELPRLEDLAKNGDMGETKRLQHLVAKLEKQMQEYRNQEDKQFELLETGKYSMVVFEERHSILQEKMEFCQKQIFEVKQQIPKDIDYTECVSILKQAIALLKDQTATPEAQNHCLKQVVKKIVIHGQTRTGADHSNLAQNKSSFSLDITMMA